jgi:formate dehydrogenase major subunit
VTSYARWDADAARSIIAAKHAMSGALLPMDVKLEKEPGLRIPNMLDAALDGTFKPIYIQGEDILQSDPDTKHVAAGLLRWSVSWCRTCSSTRPRITPTSCCPARPFWRDGTFINAERRIQLVRKVMAPKNG